MTCELPTCTFVTCTYFHEIITLLSTDNNMTLPPPMDTSQQALYVLRSQRISHLLTCEALSSGAMGDYSEIAAEITVI